MKKLLLATAALIALSLPAQSAVIEDLGVNPTSAQGDFSNSVGGAAFADQYTFQLLGGPQFVAITSATNVYPNLSDFIAGFTGSVYQQVNAVGGGDDILAFGPQIAQPCPTTANCQFVAGSGLLNPGNYYLELTGVGAGTAGYGGNLSVSPVPGPVVGAGLSGLAFGAAALMLAWRRRRNAAV